MAADSLTGLQGVEVSIAMGSNTESVVAPMIARRKAARIPLAGSPAHLRLNLEVARLDAPGLAAFIVELQLTQLVDVRANVR